MMKIKDRVEKLEEVGTPIVRAAEKLDAMQDRIDELQRQHDIETLDLYKELRSLWTQEELVAAGIFIGTKPVL